MPDQDGLTREFLYAELKEAWARIALKHELCLMTFSTASERIRQLEKERDKLKKHIKQLEAQIAEYIGVDP